MKIPDFFTLALTDGLQETTLALETNFGLEIIARRHKKLLLAIARAFRDNRAIAIDREGGCIELHVYFNPKGLEL